MVAVARDTSEAMGNLIAQVGHEIDIARQTHLAVVRTAALLADPNDHLCVELFLAFRTLDLALTSIDIQVTQTRHLVRGLATSVMRAAYEGTLDRLSQAIRAVDDEARRLVFPSPWREG